MEDIRPEAGKTNKYSSSSGRRFSVFSLLTPTLFYLLAVLALVSVAFSAYNASRLESSAPGLQPAFDEEALIKAEEEPPTTKTASTDSEPRTAIESQYKKKQKEGPEPASPVIRKVLVLDFDPIVNGHRLHLFWGETRDPQTLESQFIADIKSSSGNYVNYQIQRIKLDQFPVKADGFVYDADSFLACWNSQNHSACHMPDGVDYHKLLTDYGVDVCAMRNSGEIHELWVWGAPYFGYYESRLAGPSAFWYNSPPLTGTTCNKQLPIMGFSYERGVLEMLESMGHRTESAMSHTFGGWQQNRTAHDWDRFALVESQSPSYNYSGCGSVHYAPSSLSDYDWGNTRTVSSTCEDWLNYPYLTGEKEQLNCSRWGCNGYGYMKWWFSHLPRYTGKTNGKWNNWWRYVLDYQEATTFVP